MYDPFDPPEPDAGRPVPTSDPSSGPSAKEEAAKEEDASYPWDADLPEDEDGVRHRHDGFTRLRKREFLRALTKTGCVSDACRLTGVSKRTVYRHQGQDHEFLHYCSLALRMCETPLELTAWQRAVVGVEEQYAVGGKVMRRTRVSEGLLRLLLQGANPKKYGPRPGFKRKRILKHERKQIEREVRAEMAAKEERWSFEDAITELERKLRAMGVPIRDVAPEVEEAARLADGWTKSSGGHWIPPGYAPIDGYAAPAAEPDGEGAPAIPCAFRASRASRAF